MEKQTYYFKNVLLGLRNYYLENQKQLDKLKQYVELYDCMVQDYYFWVSQGELLFDRDIIMSQLEIFLEKFKGIIDFTTTSKCIKIDDDYVIEPSLYKTPTIINQTGFNKQVKLILDSDFIKGNIKNNIIDNSEMKLLTTTRQISMELVKEKYNLCYYANLDSLDISSLSINKRCLEELFNKKIPKEYLSAYQIEAIENSGIQDKEICIPEFSTNSKHNEFIIEEEQSKVYIIKDKYRR